jgi:hypothetical protein
LLHPLELTPSLDTAFAHFRFISANVPALRAPMSPYSRAIDTCHSRITAAIPIAKHHSGSHHHHIPKLLIVFAHTRVTSRIPLFYRAFTPL